MTMQATSVQVEVRHDTPVSLGYAVIEPGSVASRDGLVEGRDYTVSYPASAVTFAPTVTLPIAWFVLRADMPSVTLPPAPDFGAEVPDDAAFLLADRVAQLRTFLDTPNASITPAMTVGALKTLTRVALWLLRRSV